MLTEWGQMVEERLAQLGKDREWVCRTLSLRGYPYSMDEFVSLLTVDSESKTRRHTIMKLLNEEERRQKYRKMVGFRGEGICHTRQERENNSKNSQ